MDATLDASRPEAVARRRKTGQRTARENIAELVDPGSFAKYGGLALAAQRARLSTAELIAASPADGLLAGTATIDGARVMAVSSIDPAETRAWLSRGLGAMPVPTERRRFLDTW